MSGTFEHPTDWSTHLTTYPKIPWALFFNSFSISSFDQLYLLLKGIEVKITKLAQGLPVGGEIESLDDGTLFSAFKNRTSLKTESNWFFNYSVKMK